MKKRILTCAICLSAAIALAGCNTSADTTTPSSSEEVPSETTASEEPETTEDESGTTASANPEENCSFGHSDEIVGYGRVSDLLAGTYQLGLKGINTCSTETSFDESTYFMGSNDNIITYSLTIPLFIPAMAKPKMTLYPLVEVPTTFHFIMLPVKAERSPTITEVNVLISM